MFGLPPEQIQENIKRVEDRIAAACKRAGRDPAEASLLPVTKTMPVDSVQAVMAAGYGRIGENRVQEIRQKREVLGDAVEIDMIGSLQKNKVKFIAPYIRLVHSVDRASLVIEIEKQAFKNDRSIECLLQVNIAGEEQKSGIEDENLFKLARTASQCPNVKVIGLMTMPPFYDDPEKCRPIFQRLRELAEMLGSSGPDRISMTELSMGMTHDFEVAIEEGATIVRVGSAIFGPRACAMK